ncbi:MAG: DMT family transporter [Bdellovibrionales bacterium]
MTHTRAVFFLVMAATFWSIGGLFIKIIPWSPLAIAGARSFIAAIFLFCFLPQKNFKFSKAEVFTAISYFLTVSLFVTATKLTTAANAIFLQYTAPIYVVILAHFFLKETPTKKDLTSLSIIFFGMILFFYEKMSLEGFWGNICAILSGMTFAMMTVQLRAQKAAEPMRSIVLGNIIAAVVLAPFIFQAPTLEMPALLNLFILGIFQLGTAYLFYSKAVPHVTALEAIMVSMLEPILNPIWVLLMIGEKPSLVSILGGGIILAGVLSRSLMGRSAVAK